jgi:hypothetical protein
VTGSSSLAESSRAAFRRRFPDLIERLDQAGQPKSRLIGTEATGDLNLDFGHGLFYQGGAPAYAEAQLATWRERPVRFYMEPPVKREHCPQLQDHMAVALYEHFRGRSIAADPDGESGGYLLVYGIGLGLHLPALFEETPVRHFLLIEEHLEFFGHSLGLIDWASILDRLDANGQTLNLLIGTDPHVVGARVHWQLRGRGFGLIDGSYLYRHYRSTMLDLAHQDFIKNLPLLPISMGFFEDELVMLRNCTTNLRRQAFEYLDTSKRLEKDLPAIIVGSGPSLDRTIDDLRRLSGRAVIFSAGTSLQPLLRHGIRPDFHCELENGIGSVLHLEQTARHFSLSGVTLLASTTVDPSMAALFDRRVFYFRDSVCSTSLWCPDGVGIHGTAPTCTNLAMRAALVMAFRELYLFGVDLGSRTGAAHHAKDTIYNEDPGWLAAHEADPLKIMNIELPGNFGGTAFTNQILHWARMMMAQAIDAFSTAKIYNCCDGVAVPGTLPKLARTIRIDRPDSRKAVVLARLSREMTAKQAGEMAPRATLADFRRDAAEHYAWMLDEIARCRDEAAGLVTLYERLQACLARKGASPFQPVLRAIDIGTVMMCFQIGYYFYRRIAEAERPAMMRVFVDKLADLVRVMASSLDDLVVQLAA